MRFFIVLLAFINLLIAQDKADLNTKIPVDKNIITGQLENGLHYYIRKNAEPQNRAELRLAVKAGSILEDDDQLGLAHFAEHMAFNGTKNFEKHQLIDFLERSGMRFGADINAYTSFDETVYMLELPTDSINIFTKGFQVLEEWAHHVTFDSLEIEKERGVVIEEWRTRRGASARIRDKQFPVILHESKYAERLPIGKKELLESFDHESLTRFYKDWYRPNLMGIIAVGDFDAQQVESLIKEHFKNLKNPTPSKKRKYFDIPDHKETLFSIVTDPEERYSRVALYNKINVSEDTTVALYRQSLVKNLYSSMLNQRLSELTQQENPPFLFAVAGESPFTQTRGFYVMQAVVAENKIESGMEALLTEQERVLQYGFTESELEREKKSTLRSIEQALREYDKRKSAVFAAEYIRAFLDGEPIPGLEYEFQLYNQFIPGITLQEVNQVSQQWLQDKSRVITVSLPEKEGVSAPAEESLQKVLNAFNKKEITAYEDVVLDKPIVQEPAKSSAVQQSRFFEKVAVTEWTLGNGIRVVLKPTDFKNDQILFSAESPGGTSLISLDSLISAELADGLVQSSGVGNYNLIELEKYMSDKVARMSPYISSITEGFSGSASPQDLETMLQLVYAYFTAPRLDQDTFESYKVKMKAILENRANNPQTAFQDTLTALLTQNDPREKPMQLADIAEMDRPESYAIFKQRFADANDFTFFFVGNFSPDSIKPLIEKYLGSLPVLPSDEKWSEAIYDYPTGIKQKNVYKGIEPKSQASIVFTGPFEWSIRERLIATSMVNALRIKLRERIREDKSGTYGVGIRGSFERYPKARYRISISFGADPQRVEELKQEVFVQIDSLLNYGLDQDYLDKVKETSLRGYETNLRENSYWLGRLEYAWFHELDPGYFMELPEMIKSLTLDDIHNAAQKYFNTNNYVDVVLYPQDWSADKKE